MEDGELADEGKGKEAQEEEDVRMESRDNEQRENSRRGFGGFRKDVNQRVSRMVLFCTICYIYYIFCDYLSMMLRRCI